MQLLYVPDQQPDLEIGVRTASFQSGVRKQAAIGWAVILLASFGLLPGGRVQAEPSSSRVSADLDSAPGWQHHAKPSRDPSAQSSGTQQAFRDKLKNAFKQEDQRDWQESMALDFGVNLLDGQIGKWVKENGIDIRVLIVAYMDRNEANSTFGEDRVKQVLAAAAPLFDHGREAANLWVASVIRPNVYLGVVFGFGLPLGCLPTLHGLIWLARLFGAPSGDQSGASQETPTMHPLPPRK